MQINTMFSNHHKKF